MIPVFIFFLFNQILVLYKEKNILKMTGVEVINSKILTNCFFYFSLQSLFQTTTDMYMVKHFS